MMPLNFQKWIDEHRHLLKPPVGNAQVWEDGEFIVMVVGGPNARNDFHCNEGPEFFYQLEGEMNLRILENGKPKDVPIKAGEIYLLAGNVPHSPQRPANSVGLVIERKRRPEEIDGFLWICEKCHSKVYEERFHLEDIVKQLPPLFERFWGNEVNSTCKQCGTRVQKPVRQPA